MKRTFLWLLWFAFQIECFAAAAMASVVMKSLESQQRAAPAFTALLFDSPRLWLVASLPWLIAALLLTRRASPSTGAVLVYVGTIAVAAALTISAVVIGGILQLLPFKQTIGNP